MHGQRRVMTYSAADGEVARRGRIATAAAALLLVLACGECAVHQARDATSYRVGYSAAEAGFPHGAFAYGSTARRCVDLFEHVRGATPAQDLIEHDFRAGCTQAIRDATE